MVAYVGTNSMDEDWSLVKKLVEMRADRSVLPEVFQEKLELILDMK
ncbi:hypothetical protein [Alkaliphilus sp. B6464]|nr:hypothetical protein [Alkaliphilus sp. B6464]QUH20585.1 hypothetical protein HYG84_12345 [Alkaliphilus sp. B6464]